MYKEIEKSITSKIIGLQDQKGCWNVLREGDKYFPALNYYVPNYKSTLWTLILLADIQTDAVCFSSHNHSNFIHSHIKYLSFPNMYQGDYLEIL